jgi:hypothetical protein
MGEWLGALGLAWSRLLLYPGGLSALLAAWLLDRALTTADQRRMVATPSSEGISLIGVSAVAAPLLLISLLPLPRSGFFGYTPDLLVGLLLLEWPQLLLLARMLRTAPTEATVRRQVLLEGYVLLLLAILLFMQAAGSFRLDALTREIEPMFFPGWSLRLAGIAGWSIALLPLLGIGAATPAPAGGALRWGLQLRSLGHILLAYLPWLPLVQASPWLLPLPPIFLTLLLAVIARPGRRQLAHQWPRLRTGVVVGLIVIASWQTYAALAARLQ